MTIRDYRIVKYPFVFAILAMLFFAPLDLRGAVLQSLSDAYITVSTFVAITLLIFYSLERYAGLDIGQLFQKHKRWQIPMAALLGALPGCGGAIIVVTQFAIGRLGFGGLIAVLTATMGDAAFLLLAKAPMTALLVFGVSITAGIITGYIAEAIHGADFLKARLVEDAPMAHNPLTPQDKLVTFSKPWALLWFGFLAPGFVLGLGNAFQIDTNIWFGALAAFEPVLWLGAFGSFICLLAWARHKRPSTKIIAGLASDLKCDKATRGDRIIFETSFVSTWVIGAFLLYEITTVAFGLDLGLLFAGAAIFVPLMAVMIGLIPGCGPQILVTTLYLGGIVPLSAQMANAISNDGDALFPALAMAPKASIIATLYTAIPAFIVGYIFYFAGF
jgi:hypothetical protein